MSQKGDDTYASRAMKDGLHLSSHHRGVLEALLREHLPQVDVWAYGSRVNGRSHAGSDLDLALRGPGLEEISAKQLAGFSDAVHESTIPFLIEGRDWARLPERLQREIERDHVVVDPDANCGGLEYQKPKRSPRDPAPRSWNTQPLADLSDNFDAIRRPVKEADRRPGPFPYYGASGVVDHVDQYLFDGEYLLVAEDGENLHTRNTPISFLANGKFWVNNHAHILRGNAEANTRYLMYALSHLDISGYLTGSTMPKLTQRNLARVAIPTPPLHQQRAIAHILGTLDDKIELNRRMNETLEAMTHALFKSWFVDFDPVRARAYGGDVRLAHDAYQLFPDSYDDSPLGKVPCGWKVVALTELIDVNPQRPSLRKGETSPYVPMSSMPTSGHTPSQVSDRPFGSGMRFTNGDTLVARITPCLENGKTAYVDFLNEGQVAWGSTEYIVLRPKPFLPSELAYCLARSSGFREFAIQSMTGTSGRQRVQPTALGQFLLPQPPEQVGKEFGRLIRPLIGRARTAADESHRLAELRDALLPRLLSGELRVQDAERIAAAVI